MRRLAPRVSFTVRFLRVPLDVPIQIVWGGVLGRQWSRDGGGTQAAPIARKNSEGHG